MSVFMLGFAGLPLTGGFVGKFYAFAAAYERGLTWLVDRRRRRDRGKPLLLPRRDPGDVHARRPRSCSSRRWAARRRGARAPDGGRRAALVVTVGSFFAVQPLIDVAKHAAASIF